MKHVANTPGPAILGLPFCSRLMIAHLNCSLNFRKKRGRPLKHLTGPKAKNLKPINSCNDQMNTYPDEFEGFLLHLTITGCTTSWIHTQEMPGSHETIGK